MSTKLYIMIKGRTKGPFPIEKLRQLAEQNQLSKMHQVSEDQMSWVPAGDYEGGLLWQQWEEPEPEPEPEPEGPPPESEWFYTRNSTQLGPVRLSELKNLFACGELKGSEQVWTEAMEHWKAADEVPEFRDYLQPAHTAEPVMETITDEPEQMLQPEKKRRKRGGSSGDGDLSRETCKAANGARGWTIFISVVVFIAAAFLVGCSIWVGVHGIKLGTTPLVSIAIMLFISAITYIVGGLLLLNFSNKMNNFFHKKAEQNLQTALTALNQFWLYISIVLIVSLVFLAIAIFLGIVEYNNIIDAQQLRRQLR